MNRLAVAWLDEYLRVEVAFSRLEEEYVALAAENAALLADNRGLRCALWLVLVAAAERDAHFSYALDLIADRFKEAA